MDWPHGKWDIPLFFFLSAPHTSYGGQDSDAIVKCMEQDTDYIDIMYPFYITNNIIVLVLNGSTVIVKFIGQWTNAANESIHLEIIIIMTVRIMALLFFSCKETKGEIKDLFQVYTF